MGGTPSHHPFSLDFQGYSDIPLLKKKNIQLSGYPHDYGNPQVLSNGHGMGWFPVLPLWRRSEVIIESSIYGSCWSKRAGKPHQTSAKTAPDEFLKSGNLYVQKSSRFPAGFLRVSCKFPTGCWQGKEHVRNLQETCGKPARNSIEIGNHHPARPAILAGTPKGSQDVQEAFDS